MRVEELLGAYKLAIEPEASDRGRHVSLWIMGNPLCSLLLGLLKAELFQGRRVALRALSTPQCIGCTLYTRCEACVENFEGIWS